MNLLPQSVPSPYYSMSSLSNSPKRLRMQIYGPCGLRKFVRVNLQLTLTQLRGRYAVHELLGPSDEPSISCETDLLHVNENPGKDIRPDEQGLWRNVVSDRDWTVHAGPLQHRGAYSSPTFLFLLYGRIYTLRYSSCYRIRLPRRRKVHVPPRTLRPSHPAEYAPIADGHDLGLPHPRIDPASRHRKS